MLDITIIRNTTRHGFRLARHGHSTLLYIGPVVVGVLRG